MSLSTSNDENLMHIFTADEQYKQRSKAETKASGTTRIILTVLFCKEKKKYI